MFIVHPLKLLLLSIIIYTINIKEENIFICPHCLLFKLIVLFIVNVLITKCIKFNNKTINIHSILYLLNNKNIIKYKYNLNQNNM